MKRKRIVDLAASIGGFVSQRRIFFIVFPPFAARPVQMQQRRSG
jgi:hypothetical protein